MRRICRKPQKHDNEISFGQEQRGRRGNLVNFIVNRCVCIAELCKNNLNASLNKQEVREDQYGRGLAQREAKETRET